MKVKGIKDGVKESRRNYQNEKSPLPYIKTKSLMLDLRTHIRSVLQ